MKILNSAVGLELLAGMRTTIRYHLSEIDVGVGREAAPELDDLLGQLKLARQIHGSSPDEVLNDIAILEMFAMFFRSYGILWQQISAGSYSQSWMTLQDANDSLRLIRRWSGLTLSPFVEQLFALESLYPYNIFASAGWVVEWYECTICGKDIDSFECSHRTNELYRGQRAGAIARNMLHMDHIALVEHPVDRRCVITISDDSPNFSGVQYLRDAFNRKQLKVSNFGGVARSKRQVPNSEYAKIGRNDQCSCLSGKKFKHCCIDKKFQAIDNVEILPMPPVFERSEL